MSDSLYERARIGLYGVNLGAGRDDWVVLMHSALDAGEAAEKRVAELEREIVAIRDETRVEEEIASLRGETS